MGEAAQTGATKVGRLNAARVLVGVIAVLAVLFGPTAIALNYMLQRATSGDGPPQCEAPPISLAWHPEGRWRRSTPFALTGSTQVVQVDLRLIDSGNGVIPDWKTVTAVPAGTEIAATTPSGTLRTIGTHQSPAASAIVPSAGMATESSVVQSANVEVGIGVEAINEQVTLGVGTWELVVSGEPGVTTIRFPC